MSPARRCFYGETRWTLLTVVLWLVALAAVSAYGLAYVDFSPVLPPAPAYYSLPERIAFAAAEAGVPPQLALDTAWRESSMRHLVNGRVISDPDHISFGLFGLNARYFPLAAHMTEGQAIEAGVGELARLWRKYGDEATVHRAYMKGEAGMRRAQ